MVGFEPGTFDMELQRSNNWATIMKFFETKWVLPYKKC